MKTTTRILIALLLVLSLSFAFCLFVSAEGEDENAPEPEISVSEENGASEAVAESQQTWAEVLWAFVKRNSDTIFAAASALVASILAVKWKRELIPSVSKSLTMLNGALTTTATTLQGTNSETAQYIASIAEKIAPFIERADKLTMELESVRSERDILISICKGNFDLLQLIVESGRVPDSVKEQCRLYKARLDGEMQKIEGSGDVA